jgi:putative ABC transport system permease protein
MLPFLFMTFTTALRIFSRNRLRTGLTLLALAIGTATVITITSIGQGAKDLVQTQIASLGSNIIVIVPKALNLSGVRDGQIRSHTLSIADAQALKQVIPELTDTAWWMRHTLQVVSKNRNDTVPVIGVSPAYFSLREWEFSAGGPFGQAEMDSLACTAVLGHTTVETLFPEDADVLGASIRLAASPCTIIGVLAPKGQTVYGADQDNVIYIPFSAAERKVIGTRRLSVAYTLVAATRDPEDLPIAIERITQVLQERHRLLPGQPDDFEVRTQTDIAKTYEGATATLSVWLAMIAAISLLVGCIGIMNILLVSVTERTGEIGVRMAVGAKRWHIAAQFLIEAMVLGGTGGTMGVALGLLTSQFITELAGWDTSINPAMILGSLLVALATSLASGFYPAFKASRLDPIEAMRYQ